MIKAELGLDGQKRQKTVLLEKEDDIDASVKPAMLEVINAMLEEIKKMKNEFGLETETERSSRHVRAYLSEIWILLEDLKADKLSAYGHVSEEEKNAIEPHVLKLLKKLKEIEEIR